MVLNEYQAEDGMTFEEWLLSKYNTSNMVYDKFYIIIKEKYQVLDYMIYLNGTCVSYGMSSDILFLTIYNDFIFNITFEPLLI